MILARIGAALDWLGRQGMRAVALSVFIAMALPAVSSLARPLVAPSIFLLLVVAFLKIDMAAMRVVLTRPLRLALVTLWTMLVLPAVVGLALHGVAGSTIEPGVMLGIAMMLASAPVMSAPAFAALLGLDASLSLALLIASCVLLPVSAPPLAAMIAGQAVDIDVAGLALRLSLLVGGAAGMALILRRLAGPARLDAAARKLDGLNVTLLFVFALAIFDGAAARFWATPLYVLTLVALSFGLALAQVALTYLVWRPWLRSGALAIAIAAGHRNMGVMAAAATTALPAEAWLWFALAQFPIYLLPYFLTPFARRQGGGR